MTKSNLKVELSEYGGSSQSQPKLMAAKRRKMIKHGMNGTRFYMIWQGIKSRTGYIKNDSYMLYGGRGIKMCERWKFDFRNFRDDMYLSYVEHVNDNGERNTTIERINSNGHYVKENCKWTTQREQCLNRRSNRIITFNGKTKILSEWAKDLGMNDTALIYRLRTWPLDKCLTLSAKPGKSLKERNDV